jgi:hypothetical protein
VGILPLMASLPFMYWPKILEGDTQPWLFAAAVVALLTFRTDRFLRRSDLPYIILAVLCMLAYCARSAFDAELVRACYMQVAFIVFWIVCRRENGEFFPRAVRITVVIWFAVGLYQYLALAFGLPVEISGRFVEGRSGVPSLASEPSIYASLSMLQMMYLLSTGKGKNNAYVGCAVGSVILSGSALGFLMLGFPLMRLQRRVKIAALIGVPVFILAEYSLSSAGLVSRVSGVALDPENLAAALVDPSLNLRLGHLYFTVFVHFWDSLLLLTPIDFKAEYNNFAANSGVFVATGNNMILPAVGELIYSSGLPGALLMALVIYNAQKQASTRLDKIEKIAFLIACMVNPIPLANIFLIMYAQQKTRPRVPAASVAKAPVVGASQRISP